VSEAWMPDVRRIRARNDGGAMKGGAPRVVWQTLNADAHTVPAELAAKRLDGLGRASHLIWNPRYGQIVQQIPIVRAARSLGWPEQLLAPESDTARGPARRPAAGSAPYGTTADDIAEVNTEGRLCVQICVVAFAWDPFTSRSMKGREQILNWLDSWGIPRHWPAGQPAAPADEQAACRSRRLWAQGGHFGASQVPGLTVAGPGAIDIEHLTGSAADFEPLTSANGHERGAASPPVRGLGTYVQHRRVAARAGALSRAG
jgi:hypothetical protein